MFDRGLHLTLQAMRRQLAGMPYDLYLIRLIHHQTSRAFPGERLWTATELLHPATVRAWVKSGRLAAVRAGRTWRVRRSEVDRALLSDASPAYVRQEASSPPSSAHPDASRTAAPRQIANHIMTVGPGPAEPS